MGLTLAAQAERLGIKVPTARTLAKYGIDSRTWLELLALQGWACPICTRRYTNWNVDHEHVPGWKGMPPEEKRRYVRGVLCIRCNWKFVHSTIPADMAQRIATYLANYEARRDA